MSRIANTVQSIGHLHGRYLSPPTTIINSRRCRRLFTTAHLRRCRCVPLFISGGEERGRSRLYSIGSWFSPPAQENREMTATHLGSCLAPYGFLAKSARNLCETAHCTCCPWCDTIYGNRGGRRREHRSGGEQYGHPAEEPCLRNRNGRRCDGCSCLASSQPRPLSARDYLLSGGKHREADRDRSYRSNLDSSVNPPRQLCLSKSQAISIRLLS